MEAIAIIATVPAIIAIVNLLKKLGVTGKASLLAAVVLGIAINLANYYLAAIGGYQAAVEGLILGLGAAGVWDVTSTNTFTLNSDTNLNVEEVTDEGN